MTKQIISFTLLLLTGIFSLQAADSKPIRIGTNDIDLILKIGDNGRLYQSYLGERLQSEADIAFLKQGRSISDPWSGGLFRTGDPGITQRRQSFFITEICIS